jgi:hypothetical protein
VWTGLARGDLDVVAAREREELRRDVRPSRRVAPGGRYGSELDLRVTERERKCERVVDVPADVRVEYQVEGQRESYRVFWSCLTAPIRTT